MPVRDGMKGSRCAFFYPHLIPDGILTGITSNQDSVKGLIEFYFQLFPFLKADL
jgi:hypothetical protein